MSIFDDSMDFNTFVQQVNVIDRLIKEGAIRILVKTKLDTVLDEKLLKDDLAIDLEDLKGALSEIMTIMMAGLNNTEKSLYKAPDDRKVTKEEIKERNQILKKKIDLVKEVFIDEDIRNRFLIKKTSKETLFGDLSWEINSKIVDSKNDGFKPFNYAKVAIFAEKVNTVFPIEGLPPIKEKLAVFDLDLVDIEFLIDTLRKVRKQLNREGRRK